MPSCYRYLSLPVKIKNCRNDRISPSEFPRFPRPQSLSSIFFMFLPLLNSVFYVWKATHAPLKYLKSWLVFCLGPCDNE
ncbi:hypothetical protein BDQ12DRAFT_694109 [Crucibulum laeve]|uniref:Uncharacterized protein n=1 Tax=Crucibulum laeve TaxID=68775 RepID=A0A5C3LF26_9AGAR|nr:hypothetical protein BDQ12DRAFT_694109 [Crucibulum laeve]